MNTIREEIGIRKDKFNIERKLLVGKIDYINASPVYYGLDHGLVPDWIDMVEGPPAVLNAMIQNLQLDISPVSSAFYGMNYKDLLILPDLSISCHDEVLSVVLMSDFPIEELDGKTVVLTQDSATSSALVRLISARKKIFPRFITKRLRALSDVPYQAHAAMVIGDAAMTQPWEDRFRYRMDLGKLWHDSTGMPFVFALWVVRKECARKRYDEVKKALDLFYRSRRDGYCNIDRVIASGAQRLGLKSSYVRRYFELLHCDLDSLKIKALDYFFLSLYENGLLPEKVDVTFF
ncbi:MAG: menaquinone biosynthesis protein [Desulfamplus sp.]|nr:menaquinone biosynthesis protein [Desulfamplus sp.]